jgi:hypothetical protein
MVSSESMPAMLRQSNAIENLIEAHNRVRLRAINLLNPTIKTMAKIAKSLGVSIEDLIK